MRDIKKYLNGFDELNVLVSESSPEETIDVMETMLILAYTRGVEDTDDEIDYYYDTEKNLSELEKSLNKKIDGQTWKERAKEHLDNSDLDGLRRVAETEYHRVYQEASMNVANKAQKALGRTLTKKWVTVKDNNVRATHEPLEGLEKPINEKFYTIDGDEALFPGGFGKASNNVNCRCVLEFK